jgi:hypothetical protein
MTLQAIFGEEKIDISDKTEGGILFILCYSQPREELQAQT